MTADAVLEMHTCVVDDGERVTHQLDGVVRSASGDDANVCHLADVFWSIDASSLGSVADNDAYESLPDEVVDPVPRGFQGDDNAWVGVAGRARSIPYNTNVLSDDDIPNTVQEIPALLKMRYVSRIIAFWRVS